MKKNLKKSMDDFFGKEPTVGEKAWDIINQFYHLVLVKMEEDAISRADLARRLGKSRAAISHMFNETPNITVKKMVEIAEAVGLNINLTTERFLNQQKKSNEVKRIVKYLDHKYENIFTIEYDQNFKDIRKGLNKNNLKIKHYENGYKHTSIVNKKKQVKEKKISQGAA